MKPTNKIKREILLDAASSYPDVCGTNPEELTTDEEVEEAYEDFTGQGCHWDYESDYREGTVETHLPREFSRNYESRSVASQMCDGSWVGWTYWYGGGKYGNSLEIPWMEDAYDLVVTEEERLVVVRTYTKVEDK